MKIDISLPKKAGLFITATDTEVGKTLVSGAICKLLTNQGTKVGPMKPLSSGCRTENGQLINTDAELLKKVSNSQLPISTINPVAYTIPAATAVCEKYENKKVDYNLIAKSYQEICDNSDFVIVEGIGGLKVPISENRDVVDLAQWFDLPIILVARPNLGTINHTLLSIECIRNAGLKLAGVVISGYDEATADTATKSAPEFIEQYGKVKILAVIPKIPHADTDKGILPNEAVEAVADVDWKKLAEI